MELDRAFGGGAGLLLLTADAGAQARVGSGDQAKESASSATTPAQTQSAAQTSSEQKPDHIVCPVTAATNPPLSAALGSAQTLYRIGKFDEAIGAYNAIVPSGGSEAAAAYAGLARVYLKQHKVAEAYDAAMKAVALTSDRAPAMAALGDVYYRQGKLGEAEELFYKPLRKRGSISSAS